MRPGVALADHRDREPHTPPLLRPAMGEDYSALDDLLMIDAPVARDLTAMFQLQTGPLRDKES
jgi:hypothetical protein